MAQADHCARSCARRPTPVWPAKHAGKHTVICADKVTGSADAPGTEAFFRRVLEARPLLALTGAGISVASGIPTYRDTAGVWLRSDPITHREFLGDPRQRRRYWGRSALGWPAVEAARPSAAHRALAALEHAGAITTVVTQNVDRLHQRAGSRRVIDLHGRLDRVRCLDCGALVPRAQVQQRLLASNPDLVHGVRAARPDGDADLAEHEVDNVRIPDCTACGGTLMPDVVFFGGSIPAARTAEARRALEQSGGLLVIGSSLQVYSGYRFCRWARDAAKPLFIINPGATRADALAACRCALGADQATMALLAHLETTTQGAAPR
jgi:NAD-dependent SIR2 family protein deacetylase